MTWHFHLEAQAELDEAVAHYERERAGLGTEFGHEVRLAIAGFWLDPLHGVAPPNVPGAAASIDFPIA